MRSHFNTNADLATLLVPTFIPDAALAVFFIPLVTLGLSCLTPHRIPAASGLFDFARITAGSFGTSIATTSWDRSASPQHRRPPHAANECFAPRIATDVLEPTILGAL